MADPFNGKRFTMYMFLPMEVVTLSQRIKVVEVCSVTEISSEHQSKYVRQSVSCL